MDRTTFREALLTVMEQKVHWAWPAFAQGLVPRERFHVHLEQEYATYVRDFPVLVGRAYVACPVPEARRELIANVYEEETGGLFAGRPHPELFLEYPRGLGMDLERFNNVVLLPKAAEYRRVLDEATLSGGWEAAAAVTTLFVEGTAHERTDLASETPRPLPPLEEHPLVRQQAGSRDDLPVRVRSRRVVADRRRARSDGA